MSADTNQEGGLELLAADLAASPYAPVRFLARGGMGEVVVVEHRELGRKLVMKLLRSNLAGQEHLAERMRAEARMLARLSHPSLVSVVDSGRTAGGRPFLVTELLEGETLSDYVKARGGELSVREALELGIQTLAALAVVHEAGFVHRDLKPANLFVVQGKDGEARRIKILDFGIAKALSDEDRKALGLVAPTTEGAIMGTPSSVSPEQVQSGKIDARTDVYGLGVVLFRLIAGRPPFVGEALQLFRAHLLEPAPAASSIAKQPVAPIVDEILMKSLEKDPARRFQSASEMRAALERALLALSVEAEPTEVSEGEGNARTVEAPAARDTSDDETTTRPAGAAPIARSSGNAATAALPTVGSHGTAVLDLALAGSLGPTPSPSPGSPSPGSPSPGSPSARSYDPAGASVRVPPPGFAPRPDAPAGSPSPGPVLASAQRKTELMSRPAPNAPRDTMKLDDPGASSTPWKYDPAVKRAERPPLRAAAPPPRSWLSAWGPIVLAVVASVAVLLCLFVWRIL